MWYNMLMYNKKLLSKLDAKTVKSEKVKQIEEENRRQAEFNKNVEKSTDEVLKFGGKIKKFFSKKRNFAIFIFLLIVLIAGFAVLVYFLVFKKVETPEENARESQKVEQQVTKYYDSLTGELIAYTGTQYNLDGTEKKDENGKPIYISDRQAQQVNDNTNYRRINCIQIPNGTDAQPQVGLNEAKIVYEAIAEGGITRFAAIYRGSTSNVIGPVRSLRTYYLEWDTPYDCTIVHAGGEANALENVKSYAHLSESNEYMWRDYSAYYAPNNLFTSSSLLEDFNGSFRYNRSDPKTFPRITPEESVKELKKIRKAQMEASEENPSSYHFASDIYVHITASPYYNVKYTYDPTLNAYARSYETGEPHMTYTCKTGVEGSKVKPQKDCGEPTQVTPKVVVVIKVPEQLNQTNLYREDIETTGSGDAWVFENGIVIEATWQREKIQEQLKFIKKETGEELKLAPGQTFITAIANSYGYVQY